MIKEIELPPNQVAFINNYVSKFYATFCMCSLCTSKGADFMFEVSIDWKDCIILPTFTEEQASFKEFLLISRMALPETGKRRSLDFIGLLNNKLTVEFKDD